MTKLSERIKTARMNAGLSKSELARRVGVSHTAVGLWEDGSTKNLKDIHIFKIAEITNVSPQHLLYGDKVSENRSEYLTEDEQIYLKLFRAASPERQEIVADLLGHKTPDRK